MDRLDPMPSDIEDNHEKAINNDSKRKEKMKQYADKRSHAKNINLQIGDYVLVRLQKKNKLSTPFGKTPYRVTEIKGTIITATLNSEVLSEHQIGVNLHYFGVNR